MVVKKQVDYKNLDAFIVVAKFGTKGMTLHQFSDIPNLSANEIERVVNYYSVILGIEKSQDNLYGPLPLAYHLEYLFFLYSFRIKDPKTQDKRIKQAGGEIPACVLVLYPTFLNGLANKIRNEVQEEIQKWMENFSAITDINRYDVKQLREQVRNIIIRKHNIEISKEKKDAIVVTAKHFQLLEKVVTNYKQQVKLLIIGTTNTIFTISQAAILKELTEDVTDYHKEKNKIYAKFSDIEITILRLDDRVSSALKEVNNKLSGVLYFSDFSSEMKADYHSHELKKILEKTNNSCIICFAFTQNKEPVNIKQTALPEILSDAKGRTISLIDLARPKMSLELAIIEFIEHVIESISNNN